MLYTLVMIWTIGTRDAAPVVVPRIPTLAACEQLRDEITAATNQRARIARCMETAP